MATYFTPYDDVTPAKKNNESFLWMVLESLLYVIWVIVKWIFKLLYAIVKPVFKWLLNRLTKYMDSFFIKLLAASGIILGIYAAIKLILKFGGKI